ncbi:hypothetical protein B9Z55_015490 [Caenorhabditis nigoni]|uniref:Uncharacterized protein n=1 Tax=Caenorhabditis nigoni TaxID=1611254 RepID=A0A2G5UAR7_9PELO|nr:hypothetical protein B9Z55_015490 [Caenorhabditis nigoni]
MPQEELLEAKETLKLDLNDRWCPQKSEEYSDDEQDDEEEEQTVSNESSKRNLNAEDLILPFNCCHDYKKWTGIQVMEFFSQLNTIELGAPSLKSFCKQYSTLYQQLIPDEKNEAYSFAKI